jgi:hypothetical protein
MPYLRTSLLADLLDLLKLLVGSRLCVFLDLLVAAGVLFPDQIPFATNARRYSAPSHESNPSSLFSVINLSKTI